MNLHRKLGEFVLEIGYIYCGKFGGGWKAPVYSDEIGIDELAEEISYATSMTPTDVKAVLEGLLNVMPKHLRRGAKIKLDCFGTFKVIFGGTGHENAEDVTAVDIDGTRISFIGVHLR